MNDLKNKKIIFIPGLGERAKDYKNFSKYIKIYDINGTVISSYVLKEGNNSIEVHTENLSIGVYY